MLFIQPLWIDPLINDFGPMKNKQLEQQILDLAAKAGIEDGGGRGLTPEVSIIIVSWNAKEYLVGCLMSLYEEDLSRAEIIVVDIKPDKPAARGGQSGTSEEIV